MGDFPGNNPGQSHGAVAVSPTAPPQLDLGPDVDATTLADLAAALRPGTGLAPCPLPPHPSFWRWVAFDPPMRDPMTAASVRRRVLCRVCDVELGVTVDPVEALAIARRHRRALRRGDRVEVTGVAGRDLRWEFQAYVRNDRTGAESIEVVGGRPGERRVRSFRPEQVYAVGAVAARRPSLADAPQLPFD